MADVQRVLREVDATVAVENVKTLDQVRADSVATRTFATQLLVGFSIVASILTLVGVYGVLSLSVASRRREIAVRSAIGAQGHDIRRLVFTDAFRLIAGGVVAGVIAAILLSRALATFLFGVESTDPTTLHQRRNTVRRRRTARMLGADSARCADRPVGGAAQRVAALRFAILWKVASNIPLDELLRFAGRQFGVLFKGRNDDGGLEGE